MRIIQSARPNARIMLVGESPTSMDVRQGSPFSDYSGEILTKMLARVGISSNSCFITNVTHVPPEGKDFKWFYTPEGKLSYLKGVLQLKADIERTKPNIIVAFGDNALLALTNKRGLSKLRGSIYPCSLVSGYKVMGTYSPAFLMASYDYKSVAEMDLAKAKAESEFPEIRYTPRTFYLPDHKIVRRIGLTWETEVNYFNVSNIIDAYLDADWLSVDIECVQDEPGKWILDCVGFSHNASSALVLSARDSASLYYIKLLCKVPIPKVMQNGTFDSIVLAQNNIHISNFVYDTMIAQHVIYPECASASDEMSALSGKKRQSAIGKGLGFLCSIYTNEPYYKDDGKTWHETGDKDIFYRYNALDAATTYEIMERQKEDIETLGIQRTLALEMSLVQPLLAMTRRGILIDTKARNEMRDKITAEVANLQAFLNTTAGEVINVKSSKQISDLLYNKLKLPIQRSKQTKQVTADKDAIVHLARKSKNPALLSILKIRQRRDLLERYIEARIDNDKRIRCSFDITGTRSGRLSSRASIFGSGTNLQTIPEAIRSIYIPDIGKAFIYRDLSQAEARIVAHLSNDIYLIDLFADPSRDIHKETAAKIFGIPLSEVTDTQRFLGKKARHAMNYEMKADRFVEVVNEAAEETGVYIDRALAQRVIDGFFLMHPNHKTIYWANIQKELNYSRTLTTPLGRRRAFYGRWNDVMLREGYSFVPQSTIGDLCNMAVVRCYNEIELGLPHTHAELLLCVHDSILMQCDIEHIDEVAISMGRAMDNPFTMSGREVRIPTDCKVGYNWANASLSNPQGLQKYVSKKA